jgi:hypothetical protein
LLEEFVLPVFVCLNLWRQADTALVDGIRITLGNVGRPSGPGDLSVRLFAGHEQREVIEPVGIVLAEFLEMAALHCLGRLEEFLGGTLQEWKFESNRAAVVDSVIGHCASSVEINLAQESLFDQRIEVDEQGIAGAGREALEWGVPVTGRIQRQYLPQLVTGSAEKIQEAISFRTEVANAMRAWE